MNTPVHPDAPEGTGDAESERALLLREIALLRQTLEEAAQIASTAAHAELAEFLSAAAARPLPSPEADDIEIIDDLDGAASTPAPAALPEDPLWAAIYRCVHLRDEIHALSISGDEVAPDMHDALDAALLALASRLQERHGS